MSKYLNSKVNRIPQSVIGEMQVLCASQKGIIPLSIGEPDFDTPWHIREEAIYALKNNKTHYTVSYGMGDLREEIANYLNRKFNLKYNKEQIIATLGASEAIDITFRCILEEGDEVILCKPAYVAYEPIITMAGGKTVSIELKEENNFKLKKEDLIKAITPKTKAILLNFPSNPTGGVMTKEDLDEIVPILKESGIVIISDEIYAELTYDFDHYSIANYDELKDQVVLVSGFSKAYAMTGWRLGYICANQDLAEGIRMVRDYTIMSPNTFAQYGAVEALKHGDNDIEKMKAEFERRRNYVVSRLNDMGLKCAKPNGAFYAFPNVSSTGMDGREFAMRLVKEKQVAVVPGIAFGENSGNNIRISYASKMEDIKEALNRIEEFVKENTK
ncbi:MAG: pyridoxal phosphate-dependent aminotransferase [Erysipelotrichaceae bacterium]|nr:pyridoxal phosphate-dependent aminotransferase [Erysipelotrichaceae bacterium]